MTLYSLFEPPALPGSEARPVAVADRFSWFAFLLPPLYMLVHRLWLVLVVYLLAIAMFAFVRSYIGGGATLLVYLLLAAWFGLEAPSFQRGKLMRRKFAYRGDFIAADRDLAELEWLKLRDLRA